MPFYHLKGREAKKLGVGVSVKTFWGERMLASVITAEVGSSVPMHSHPHEQIGFVLEGRGKMVIGAGSASRIGMDREKLLSFDRPDWTHVRFESVLADVPLRTGSPHDYPCGKCHVCIGAWPSKAFTGVEFRPEEGREVRLDVFKCYEYRRDHPCGVCVSACPRRKMGVRRATMNLKKGNEAWQ